MKNTRSPKLKQKNVSIYTILAISAIILMAVAVGASAISISNVTKTNNLSHISPASNPIKDPNFLVVILDDVGVEQIAAYGEGANPVNTPNINQLAAEGMLFRNGYAYPLCSPTRATLQTGRYAFRHGIGLIVQPTAGIALSHAETTIPEMLDLGTNNKYAHALFGKWHLGNFSNGYHDSPNLAGYDHYSGSLWNIGKIVGTTYFNWQKTVDGNVFMQSGYITTDTVNDTITWVDQQKQQSKPWLAVVAFHAPHSPFHVPPANLTTMTVNAGSSDLVKYQAALEALDTEFGRLIQHLKQTGQYNNTTIILFGDNGTPQAVAVPPIPADHAKWSLYEGGTNVPFIVRSPLVTVRGSESAAFVNVVDVFATIAEIAGVNLPQTLPGIKLDSVSMVPYLKNANASTIRAYNFSERFSPLGTQYGAIPPAPGTSENVKAMRNDRYKVIWHTTNTSFEMYDLLVDPYERTNLLTTGQGLNRDEQAVFYKLWADMNALVNG